MQGALLHIQGNWAQFRKPETNNTPLTHDFLTKTALIGLIGAVLGIERDEMRPLFPILCEDIGMGFKFVTPSRRSHGHSPSVTSTSQTTPARRGRARWSSYVIRIIP